MNCYTPAALILAATAFAPPLQAQTPPLHYHWTKGRTLRFLIQRDPYFADPKGAIETINPDAAYQPPIVERLTEKVRAVAADGTATLTVTLASEPGFEDDMHPQAALTRTVTATALGQVLSVSGPALGDSPAEQDLLRGIALLPAAANVRKDGLTVEDRSSPQSVTQSTSPDHDGTLLQTTRCTQSDHVVFDSRRGELVRQLSTRTIALSLVMTGRGRRGTDDFGHVIPNTRVVQTLSVEQRD